MILETHVTSSAGTILGEWLLPTRIDPLKTDLLPVIRLLKLSGHYKSVLSYWVRLQIAAEVILSEDERSSQISNDGFEGFGDAEQEVLAFTLQ